MGLMKLLSQQEHERRAAWAKTQTEADRKAEAVAERHDDRLMGKKRQTKKERKAKRQREMNFPRWC